MGLGLRHAAGTARTLRVLWVFSVTLAADPAAGQLPDAFARHFGASRTHEVGIRWSVGMGIMLLTQFDSRWVEGLDAYDPARGPEMYDQFDDLRTTVGYNYVSLGAQRSWPNVGPGGTAVLSASITGGVTSDEYTRTGQNGLHDFRRFPHVQRATVDDGVHLYGGELEASYWWRLHFWGIDLDLHPHLGGGWSSYHREATASAAIGVRALLFRLQGGLTGGLLYGRSGIQPAAVGTRLDDSYWSFDVSLAFDRTRYGSAAAYIPSGGFAVTRSSGIFVGQPETLLSVFFDFPSFSNDSFRLEVVNDLLADKDRGPTGGLRLTYVHR